LLGAILLQIIFVLWVPNYLLFLAPADVDRIESGPYAGNYLVTDGFGATIQIIDFNTRQILWETDEPAFFVHDADMLPDGQSIVVADTTPDRVFVMNLSTNEILWEWYAKNTTRDAYCDYLNWTDYALRQGWGPDSIALLENFNPPDGYYTHLNTVQFIEGSLFNRTYDSILISLRNLDLVVEVNYTAHVGEPGYMNITWSYGIPGNTSVLNRQHAPKRWPNGHVSIADSENGRILEIDENNQIVWEFTDKRLRWPRDCELLPNGNYLITDSTNNRIIEVNRTTKQIVKSFSRGLNLPYEADYTSTGQIIVGNTMADNILIYDYNTGKIVERIGIDWMFLPLILTFVMIIAYHAIDCLLQFRSMKEKSVKERLRSHKIYSKFILIAALVLIIIFFYTLIAFMWHFSLWKLGEIILHP
ncbi:MAG: hypothetical protein ACTSQQ_15980, partial [Candidatus Helarchaeota archaeon]